MRLRDFIRKNRAELDQCIQAACNNLGRINDHDREQWIHSDESLYLWAKRYVKTL